MLEGLTGLRDKMTSRFAAKWFAIAGSLLLLVCLGRTAYLEHIVAPDTTSCDGHLPPVTQTKDQDALMTDGTLQLLAVWPTQAAINHHVCIVVGGVVPQAAEVNLADGINRARKTRDGAQASYEAASGSARDTAWNTLQAADTALQKALTAAAAQPQPVALSVFLNGKTAPGLTVQARATSGQQALLFWLKVPNDAGESGATFWRELLSGQLTSGDKNLADEGSAKVGQKALAIGLSRSATTMPDTTNATITVIVYDLMTLAVGTLSLLCFAVSFCGLARQTTMLRDNKSTRNNAQIATDALTAAQTADQDAKAKLEEAVDSATTAKTSADDADSAVAKAADDAAKAAATEAAANAAAASGRAQAAVAAATTAASDAASALKAARAMAVEAAKTGNVEQPVGPYSLARTQMAFWMFLTVTGFIFIWLTMGIYLGLITGGILVLLGINATSGMAAISLSDGSDETSTTDSFFLDILSDGKGPVLHRIQAVAWTCILGILFIWNVVWSFTFVNFDTNLLLLVGVAQSMYVGFKWKEAPAAPADQK
ncbi:MULTISPECIES: hypothetical protein [unclassified Mesorhizobium]|uniref:hypothetical protein n=2 Tax=unclassified Mesorhizobium TaxID=325217 RepID=UPI0003CDF85C|nr:MULTISPECIES: hypothetical protein [unclassified Mesorhizobium]ESX78131.1 hypothetical protein X757_08245 [Mesorhizobium sp. LSHC414A00]